jgi:hypothetical protein
MARKRIAGQVVETCKCPSQAAILNVGAGRVTAVTRPGDSLGFPVIPY